MCSHGKTSLRVLIPLLLLGVTDPARAQVIINQGKALMGNVTPGDAAGFPVTLSQPGSYVLTSTLTVSNANTHAIDITVDDVTVDLNGFVIQGPTVCIGSGGSVSCSPRGRGKGVNGGRGTVVINGHVRGMGHRGLSLGQRSRVEHVTASSNGAEGISASSGSTLVGNTTSLNGRDGISAPNSTVSGNTAINNAKLGI